MPGKEQRWLSAVASVALIVAEGICTWVTLVCNVFFFNFRAWNLAWIFSIAALYYYSKANHFPSAAKVIASAICSRSPLVSVTVPSRFVCWEHFFFRGPLIGFLVHFVPQGEAVPSASSPSVPRSGYKSSWVSASASFLVVCFCCASFCAVVPVSFHILLLGPSVSLMMKSGINFVVLVPSVPFVPVLKPIFQLRG